MPTLPVGTRACRRNARPLRDDDTSREGFYSGWPAMSVRGLDPMLPRNYVAGPCATKQDGIWLLEAWLH